MTDLEPEEREALLSFLGYGNAAAPLRFMGAEEGLGGAMSSEEEASNLRARCTWPVIADLKEAHATLKEGGRFIDISKPRAGSTGVWRFMARIALAAEDRADFNDDRAVTAYVRHKLGRTGGTTFLTELSPIPLRRSRRDPLASEDLRSLLEARRSRQLELLRNREGVTICFGSSKREEFAEHLELRWKPVSKKVWSSDDGQTFLLPFFGNGQLSKRDVAEFVSSRAFRSALRRIEPQKA